MLALIAGTGDLPGALVAALPVRPLICAMDGFEPAIKVDLTFRIETLGSFLATLRSRGIRQVCMAGAVRRPQIDAAAIDAKTSPLVPRLFAAMAQGDDGALRAIIAIFEEVGLKVIAAHDLAPDLLPPAGVLTQTAPTAGQKADLSTARAAFDTMGRADLGQSCIIRDGAVIATETEAGTDAMLRALDPTKAAGGTFWKAPKPGQDRRADLPTIGPRTATLAAEAGLAGIAIAAGGVLVLDLPQVISILNARSLFLWVVPA